MRAFLAFGLVRGVSVAILFAAVIRSGECAPFAEVPELGYKVAPDFFQFPALAKAGEATAVAINGQGHIFLFRRAAPMLCEFDAQGNFIRSIGDGLFTHPHGLRIDREGNLWTTDDGVPMAYT
jgi:streptogramin lyase